MKRILTLILTMILTLSVTVTAAADFEPQTDYMQKMIVAAAAGDVQAGREAQEARNSKLSTMEEEHDFDPVAFDDLYLLAKIIEAEAGSCWLPDSWKLAVGEVVLNRIASGEFPDTMPEVIYQPGQYYSRGNQFFAALIPTQHSAELAARLLEGERVINDGSVVFQANFVLGSGICMELTDNWLGKTYLCYSSNPSLYNT